MRTSCTTIIGMAAVSVCLLGAGGCGSSSNDHKLPTASISSPSATDTVDSSSAAEITASNKSAEAASKPRVNLYPEVEIKTNVGRIRIKLNAEKAPQTVENFLVNYVDRDFYTGTVFHYVERDYIVMAGGYTADLQPKKTRTPIRNEAGDAAQNVRGTVAMSRDPEYADSATSQFFINLVDNASLDFQETEENGSDGYCVFGEVIEGMDVVDRIAKGEVQEVNGFPNVPVDSVVIESISRLDQNGSRQP